MANKKQDSSVVTERRLRPIYDYLDIGNNKVALTEAEKLLKKQPDLICAKALRALAFIRLGRTVEALVVLEEIEQQHPDEEYTLQALSYCYRDLGTPDRIITLYERATKKHPQNEDFLSHLMMAYVRVGEYKRQNQTAMQLYKLRPTKNPYYFWSVMSIVMQAYDDPKLARTMYLPLAERMIDKFIQSDKLNAEAEVKLYVLILEMQEKYAEAIAVLQGDLTRRFVKCMWESNQKVVELLEKLRRWQEVFNLCEAGLVENLDDWFYWIHLMWAGFELMKGDGTKRQEIIDKLTKTVLSKLSEDSPKDVVCRGPYLARLRLIALLLESDYVVRSELGEPSELLLEYFRLFGDKPSLFDDLKPFLWLLGEEQQNSFISKLEEACGDLPVGFSSSQSIDRIAQNLKQMTKHQSALQLARCLRRHAGLSSTEKQTLVVDLVQRYEAALAFGADLQSTEMQHADGYLLLALHTMWDIYLESGDLQCIFEMILLSEQGLKRSPSNFRVKSLLMKLYSLVGGGLNIVKLCESIDTKYVLRETLWYLICDQLTPWGLYGDLVDWSRASLTFYAQSEKEIADCVVQCYKAGSFPKIVECFDFRKKLRNSFHHQACRIWRRYFAIINDGANIDLVVNILNEATPADALKGSKEWSSYTDNCDYTVNPFWDPIEVVTAAEAKRQESYQQQIDNLRFYQLVLALLSSLLDAESSTCCPGHAQETPTTAASDDAMNGDVTPKKDDSFSNVLSELRAHCKHCGSNYASSTIASQTSTILNNPVSGYFGVYLAGNYLDVLICALESIFHFVKATVKKHDCEKSSDEINALAMSENDSGAKSVGGGTAESQLKLPVDEDMQHLLKAMFASHQLSGSGGGFPFMQICHVSFLVQTLSIVLVAVTLAMRRVQATREQTASKEKKQKKKKGQQTAAVESAEDPLTADFIRFSSIFCQAAETTLRLIEDLNMLLEADMSLCILNDTTIVPAEFCATKSETAAGLRASYKNSIKQLQLVMSQNLAAVSAWCREKDSTK